jgi:hypothetical protein
MTERHVPRETPRPEPLDAFEEAVVFAARRAAGRRADLERRAKITPARKEGAAA